MLGDADTVAAGAVEPLGAGEQAATTATTAANVSALARPWIIATRF